MEEERTLSPFPVRQANSKFQAMMTIGKGTKRQLHSRSENASSLRAGARGEIILSLFTLAFAWSGRITGRVAVGRSRQERRENAAKGITVTHTHTHTHTYPRARSDSDDDARPFTAGGGACLHAAARARARPPPSQPPTARVKTDHRRHHW